MKNTPVDYQTARKIIDGYGLPDFGKATIREVVAISTQLEQETKQNLSIWKWVFPD